MAIVIALPRFEDVRHNSVPIFLLMDHFIHPMQKWLNLYYSFVRI